MRTIFCPVDFSRESQLAAEWAAVLAIKRNWKLVLFNKFQIFNELVQGDNLESDDPVREARQKTENKLLDLKNKLCLKFEAAHLLCDIDTGFGIDIEDDILRAAEKSRADMIVMGTRGAESFSDIVGGSNTSNVISQTNIPVLVVPANTEVKLPDTLVYASDLKNENPENISFILELANDLAAKTIVVHFTKEGKQASLAKLKAMVSNLITPFVKEGMSPNIDFEEIQGKDFYSSLQEFMNARGADLVVIEKHPKNFFEKLMEGDFTRLMALYSSHPLLVLHKKE